MAWWLRVRAADVAGQPTAAGRCDAGCTVSSSRSGGRLHAGLPVDALAEQVEVATQWRAVSSTMCASACGNLVVRWRGRSLLILPAS
jgi:hypothetical protein